MRSEEIKHILEDVISLIPDHMFGYDFANIFFEKSPYISELMMTHLQTTRGEFRELIWFYRSKSIAFTKEVLLSWVNSVFFYKFKILYVNIRGY